MAQRVNYDEIASTYDARYAGGLYREVLQAIRALVQKKQPQSALEVGCGTGYWLSTLRDLLPRAYGLDYSLEMLRKAANRDSRGSLVRGSATALPFRSAAFDLIFCVNAVHHFERLEVFVTEARRLLKPGGTLVTIGMDPHHRRDNWCVYEYFPETRATDLARFPSSGQITDAMLQAGFDRVECGVACRISETRVGRAVLDDPELQRRGCSQMALLTDEQYAAGIARIESALQKAEGSAPAVFHAEIAFMLQCGTVDR
jgi:SAM-dependent methyltransferase